MLNAIIPYDGDAAGPSPGARYVAKYRRQADWHERVLLWKLKDSECIIVTPHGDRYVEDLADYEAQHWMAVDAGGLPLFAEIPTKGGGKGGRPRVKAKAKGRPTGGGDAY